MLLFKRIPQLNEWIRARKQEGKQIGFVPTMGALHEGHISLMKDSLSESDITVVSIFVNPRQFNDPVDLQLYPRPLEEDIHMLIKSGIDVLFIPDPAEIYPKGDESKLNFDPGPLASVMEAKFRPGHFEGVAEVVYRLLKITDPDRLYMGQKDFQQLTIIRKMIHDLHLPVHLIMCPTLREANGLAMSSRNERLSKEARDKAGMIYQTLFEAQREFEEGSPIAITKENAMSKLLKLEFMPEYFEIVDGISLQNINDPKESQFIVACCAVRLEDVRLIDNLIWTEN
jgi:pantoate--beta-alanine ligase